MLGRQFVQIEELFDGQAELLRDREVCVALAHGVRRLRERGAEVAGADGEVDRVAFARGAAGTARAAAMRSSESPSRRVKLQTATFASSFFIVAARALTASAAFDGTRTSTRPGGTMPWRSAGLSSRSTASSTFATSATWCSDSGPSTATRLPSRSFDSPRWKPYVAGSVAISSVAKNVGT